MAERNSPPVASMPSSTPVEDFKTGAFNLIDELWIPVLYNDGRCARVGIQKALEEAGNIRQIAASNPMDRVALLRFLIAVLYWCHGNPAGQGEKDQILAEGEFPEGWLSKLQERRDCFNLLGEGQRFYQDSAAKRQRAVTDLIQEIPTGNNFWHFRHSTDGGDGLCAACCATGLLRLPMFSVSGLPDLKAGINGTPPIYVVPLGRSLLHTLALNWVSRDPLGLPAWENPGPALAAGEPVPLLNGLTMLSRRIWLGSPNHAGGICIGCGQKSALVYICEYQSAGAQRSDDWDDPHVIYLRKRIKAESIERKALTATDLTKSSFRMDKPWIPLFREISSSARFNSDSETHSLLIVGLATDKAKNVDVWERSCTIPATTTEQRDRNTEAISLWDSQGRELALRPKPGESNSRCLEFTAAITAVRPHIESRVSGQIAEMLAGHAQFWPWAEEEYRKRMADIAISLEPGFTTKALQRRTAIACTAPIMMPQSVSRPHKPGNKKGGRQ